MYFIFKYYIFSLNLVLIFGKPEQIHLSLGANPTQMMVTFTTKTNTNSTVVYNKVNESVKKTVFAQITEFDDTNYKAFIHRVMLTGLEPGQLYEYKCGSATDWSNTYKFKAVSNQTDIPMRYAIYGDLGLENAVSLPQLKKDVEKGMYDTVFHIGDFAYDLNSKNGSVGDDFMNSIEPIAANVPYQACPGNHEEEGNFTHYMNRFSMIDSKSGQMNNNYYSFNLGLAHFISFSSEYYYWPEYFNDSHVKMQYQWLENDLKEANRTDNREKRPWIITMAHRPMYCLTENNDWDCYHMESTLRSGKTNMSSVKQTDYGLEDLFYKYGVDIQFYGHVHLYERSYPTYNSTKMSNNYDNPRAPIHIISGAAGTNEKVEPDKKLPDYVAFIAKQWGFTRMDVQNKTHILIEQFSTENISYIF